jgi:hypothetical protein
MPKEWPVPGVTPGEAAARWSQGRSHRLAVTDRSLEAAGANRLLRSPRYRSPPSPCPLLVDTFSCGSRRCWSGPAACGSPSPPGGGDCSDLSPMIGVHRGARSRDRGGLAGGLVPQCSRPCGGLPVRRLASVVPSSPSPVLSVPRSLSAGGGFGSVDRLVGRPIISISTRIAVRRRVHWGGVMPATPPGLRRSSKVPGWPDAGLSEKVRRVPVVNSTGGL